MFNLVSFSEMSHNVFALRNNVKNKNRVAMQSFNTYHGYVETPHFQYSNIKLSQSPAANHTWQPYIPLSECESQITFPHSLNMDSTLVMLILKYTEWNAVHDFKTTTCF